jgi:dihydroorotate dehydrogenase (NAD+) catalytic subunit
VIDLSVQLGRLTLPNPILVASGTFGYVREMAPFVDLTSLGGVVPKTVTLRPRAGNPTPRTVETAAGMLNAIGLDNDGIDHFRTHHLPYLRTVGTPIIANVAGEDEDGFVALTAMLNEEAGLAAVELNLSCPNVSHGLDLGIDPAAIERVVRRCREAGPLPVIAKLTPNVTDVVAIARAAHQGGADAVSLVNTFRGLAVDWRRRRPILAYDVGGLSGPAIKPLALRMVWEVSRSLPDLPIIGIGGVSGIDDVMEFLVAGATAVQIGTATFADPTVSGRIVQELPGRLKEVGAKSVREIVGTLRSNRGG